MSNYIKATDFASKDALPAGDAGKIVRGAEIDDEFSNIQTAVNSKADSNSPTLTGTPAAPTAAAGTNTTQLATTAFVATAVDNINTLSSFTLEEVGTDLLIKYSGTTVAKITSAGAFVALDDVTAFGSL